MTTISASRGGLVIVLSIALTLVLTIFPLPEAVQPYRPQWVALVILYWCMAIPERVGVGISFLSGILLDVLTGSLLGQHALGLSVIAFITVQTHQRVRVFPLWQQSIFIGVLLVIDRLLMLWIDGATGRMTPGLVYWAPPLIGILLWPWVYIVMRDLRRRFHVR